MFQPPEKWDLLAVPLQFRIGLIGNLRIRKDNDQIKNIMMEFVMRLESGNERINELKQTRSSRIKKKERKRKSQSEKRQK